MMALIGIAGVIFVFCVGVCLGAAATEDMDGGWWVLPCAVMGGLLMAAVCWSGWACDADIGRETEACGVVVRPVPRQSVELQGNHFRPVRSGHQR